MKTLITPSGTIPHGRKLYLEINSNAIVFFSFKDKQIEFINAISKGSTEEKLLHIVIIWRRDISHIKYEWVSGADLDIEKSPPETREQFLNFTKKKLDSAIHRLLKTSEALSYEAFVKVS